ncbi:hypothetical protein GJ496_003408 [Pomphorhynchus laevis]|nr:hypothetical protein GJ496_003408 [Pomphorhynchus laevis]
MRYYQRKYKLNHSGRLIKSSGVISVKVKIIKYGATTDIKIDTTDWVNSNFNLKAKMGMLLGKTEVHPLSDKLVQRLASSSGLPENTIKESHKLFNELSSNSGHLSKTKFIDQFKKCNSSNADHIACILFEYLDCDNSGYLTFTQFFYVFSYSQIDNKITRSELLRLIKASLRFNNLDKYKIRSEANSVVDDIFKYSRNSYKTITTDEFVQAICANPNIANILAFNFKIK